MAVGRYLSSAETLAAVRHHDRGPGPVQRMDRMAWRIDTSTKVVHPNGMVDCRGVATRTGVLLYEDEQGHPVRELRPASEVFSATSLQGLVGAPITLQHPGDGPDPDGGAQEVTAQNYRDLAHGHVLSVEPEESTGLVWVWVRLASAEILEAAARGTVELSCGYTALLVDHRDPELSPEHRALVAAIGPEPGLAANGEKYDLIQTQIEYNHLAVVDQARAGHVARLHLDRKGRTMGKITIKRDGKTTHTIAKAPQWIVDAALGFKPEAALRADADGVLSVEIEGKPPMVLPEEMVSQMLAAVGMGGGGPSASEPPIPDADPMKNPAEMMADADPEKEEPEPAADKRDAAMAAKVERMVADALAKQVPKASAKIADAATTRARDRADLERKAAPVLGPRFDYAAHDDHGLAVEVLRADKSPRLTSAEALAQRARKGDGVAAGRLAQMLDDAIEQHRDGLDSTHALGVALFSVAAQHRDAQDEDDPPSWTKKRDSAMAARTGKPAA